MTPTKMASAREAVRETAEAYHQKQTGSQINRVVEHLVFVIVKCCEFLSQLLLDVMAQHPALEFVNAVDHITVRSHSHVSPSIVESPGAFFAVVCPKRLQVKVHAVEALILVRRGPVFAGYCCFGKLLQREIQQARIELRLVCHDRGFGRFLFYLIHTKDQDLATLMEDKADEAASTSWVHKTASVIGG